MSHLYNVAKKSIKELSVRYSNELKSHIDLRTAEMEKDDTGHYLIYQVLGISLIEGKNIDVYQNKGRFLYKYAGSFLEEAAIKCFELKFPNAKRKHRIPNSMGTKPKTFEIDCLVDDSAYEIKWRDATTDGDHITKEHTRVQTIKAAGLHPVRVMFYYPNRNQARKIQETLKTLYQGLNGDYFYGDDAWNEIRAKTEIDLLKILQEIARESTTGGSK